MKTYPGIHLNGHSNLRLAAVCGLLGIPAVLSAQTTLISGAIGNGDFESPNVTSPTLFSGGTITNWSSWTEQDTTATDTGIYDSPSAGGSQVAYIQSGGAIRNLTTYTIQAGDYIDFGFTDIQGSRSDATMQLIYDDGTGVMVTIPATDLVGTTASGQNGIVFSRNFVVAAGSPWVGKKLGVGLFTTGSYPEVDNVTLSVSPPPANLLYWDGTTPEGDPNGGFGTWDLATANWDTALTGGAASIWTQGGTATFAGSFNGLVTVSGAISANRLIFDLAGYQVTGTTLTMTGTTPTITSNQNATLSATLGNGGALVKNGAGTLTLSGDGSGFANTIRNTAGPLVVNSANWGSAGFISDGAAITFNNGGPVTVGSLTLDNTVLVDNGTPLNVSTGNITQTGGGGGITSSALTVVAGTLTSSSGTLTFTDPTTGSKTVGIVLRDFNGSTPLAVVLNGPGGNLVGDISFGAANTYSGGTTINKGRLTASAGGSLSTGAVTINDGGQVYLSAAGVRSNNFTIAGAGWPETDGTLGALRFDGTGSTISGSVTVAPAGARIVTYSGAVGTISGALIGSGNLELNSAGAANMTGTLNLTGSGAGYSGTLTVANGRLNLSTSLGGSVIVQDTGTLGGEVGLTGNLQLGSTGGAGAILAIDPATPGTLVANNVTLEGITRIDFASAPPSGTPISLLSYTGTLTNNSGGTLADSFTGLNTYRNSGVTDVAKSLKTTITTETHQWTGATSTFWEVGGSDANWTSSDTFFFNGDSITFGNAGAGTITLDDLEGDSIRPSSITFTNTTENPYHLDGTIGISGSASLAINGTGSVTLLKNHTFTGGTTVNSGTLELDESVNDGAGVLVGQVTVNAGGTLRLLQTNVLGWNGVANSVKTLNINGGSVQTTAAGDNGWGLVINMTGGELGNEGNGTGYFSMGGDNAVGAPAINTTAAATTATISADIGLRNFVTAGMLAITVANGSPATDLAVTGDILSHNPNTGISKAGPGTMLLSGTNTYTGTTLVQQGSLSIAGIASIPANLALVTVNAGAGFGGIVGPGHLTDADIQSLVNTVIWQGGSYLVIDTNGADVTVAANITGNIGILKKGDGVLTLTGANTYTGGNIVEAGSIAGGGGTTIGNVTVSKSGSTVSLNFTATGNVDVYASDTLAAPWTKVGNNVAAPVFQETGVTAARRFYVLVPTGTTYPPTP